ncbi:MAG: hypothetical protein JKY45_07790 [Emcibacter sp.]|nr:hypothetical protein [Emcibacter sp.]
MDALKTLAENIDGIAVPLDFSHPAKAKEQAEAYLQALSGHNILFTNLNELDRNTDLAAMLALVSDLRNIGSCV